MKDKPKRNIVVSCTAKKN